jgi:hypothetical protein
VKVALLAASRGEHRGRANKKPRIRRGQVKRGVLTICKPTRSEMVNALHRPDGLGTFYHAHKSSARQKRGPKPWGVWGRRGFNNNLLYSYSACDGKGRVSQRCQLSVWTAISTSSMISIPTKAIQAIVIANTKNTNASGHTAGTVNLLGVPHGVSPARSSLSHIVHHTYRESLVARAEHRSRPPGFAIKAVFHR